MFKLIKNGKRYEILDSDGSGVGFGYIRVVAYSEGEYLEAGYRKCEDAYPNNPEIWKDEYGATVWTLSPFTWCQCDIRSLP